jgi:hypothetical protein
MLSIGIKFADCYNVRYLNPKVCKRQIIRKNETQSQRPKSSKDMAAGLPAGATSLDERHLLGE